MFCGSTAEELLPPYVVYKSEDLWDARQQISSQHRTCGTSVSIKNPRDKIRNCCHNWKKRRIKLYIPAGQIITAEEVNKLKQDAELTKSLPKPPRKAQNKGEKAVLPKPKKTLLKRKKVLIKSDLNENFEESFASLSMGGRGEEEDSEEFFKEFYNDKENISSNNLVDKLDLEAPASNL